VGSMNLLDQIRVTPLQKIATLGGDVWHALKSTEESFQGFGEAYFSWVEARSIKAWKQHLRMTMNLVVPLGSVRFVFHDLATRTFREEIIGESNYQRLTVPPKIWFGFQGISAKTSLVLNLANLPHDPAEVERKMKEEIHFKWREDS
jgi:dTDP-4-dehydrorhamnose 3,5-epimerase